jgi:hypothetical protein
MAGFLLVALLLAQAPPRQPCSSPEYRQFDFWVGEWIVHNPKGQQVGTNRIKKVEGGCGLQENWTASNGSTGRSINAYHPAIGKWVQAWVGGGSTLLLEGGYDGEKMVLSGVSAGPSGAKTRDRITWSRVTGGKVRQVWEQSTDEGKTWTVAFDGTYSPRATTKE